MEQLSVPSMNQPLPGQPGAPGVNGRGGGRRSRPCGTASSVRCGALRKPSFTRLVIFHHPSLFHRLPLSLSLFLSPGPSLHSVQGLFWCQENTHKQAATCTLSHTGTRSQKRQTKTQRRHTHNQKVSKGLSYLISIVIALSFTDNPLVWLPSDSQKKGTIHTYKYNLEEI